MTITLTLTAETAAEFREQILALAGQYHLDFTPAAQDAPGSPLASVNVPEPSKPVPAKKTRQRAPVAPAEPVPAPVEDDEDFDPFVSGLAQPPQEDAKALLELKQRTMTTLQQAFADGKVDRLRDLLVNHGNGAKSFPEIDAAAFKGIAEAIKLGALDA